ncbi:hypothetical protein N7463_000733 [Penicillium fimorum]|uniref:Uncharacterized protein n=1 Tax=Penicillium fimorum TaxID=1882269 RepID=A0A9W9Y4V5_9EURO|nr:hypothetical protein N7463_000733 [Penicillium fimorum]
MGWSTEGAEDVEGAENADSESIIATEIVAKEHYKLFFKLKTSENTDKLEDKSKQYMSVQISEMSLEDVEQCLRLQFDRHDMEMKDVQSFPLPPPRARWVVDSIVLNAYATATSNIRNAQPLNVQCERGYTFGPVTLKQKRVILSGRPDSSVWYGESVAWCLIVLIVEAKGGAKGSNPIPQLLGYMGCIHRGRKDEQKRNCGIYGMAYIGSRSLCLVWMLRRAAAISPAHPKETYSGVGSEEMDVDLIAK